MRNPLRHLLSLSTILVSLILCAIGSTVAAAGLIPLLLFKDIRSWQKLIDWIIYQIFNKFLVHYLEKVAGLKLHWYGDRVPPYETALVIANHTSLTDFMLVLHLAARKGRVGSCKYFAKDSLKWIPGFGWGLWLHGSVLLKRDWLKDHDSITKTFSYLRTSNFPFWLINFLEGTRRSPAKIKASQEFAKKEGLPLWKHVMVPRVKGFQASVMALHDKVDAVYDLTFGYDRDEGIPTLWAIAGGGTKPIHVDVVRLPIKAIPQDPKALSDWAMQRFARKEKLLAHLAETGRFPTQEFEEPLNDLPQGFEKPITRIASTKIEPKL